MNKYIIKLKNSPCSNVLFMKAIDREEPRHDLGSVSRRFNSEAQVRARDRQCDVFGGQSDIGTDFSPSS